MLTVCASIAAMLAALAALPVRAGASWRGGGRLRAGLRVGPLCLRASVRVRIPPEGGACFCLTGDGGRWQRSVRWRRTKAAMPFTVSGGAVRWPSFIIRRWSFFAVQFSK